MRNRINQLLNSPEWNALRSYYAQSTLFNVLHIERKETIHSAFIAWLLNPLASHNLGARPIKALLRYYATKSKSTSVDHNKFCNQLLTSTYQLKVVAGPVCEKTTGSLKNDSDKDRMDIWAELHFTFDDQSEITVPLIIENKVYSAEGDNQTIRYATAMDERGSSFIGIFLTPMGEKAQESRFQAISYQDLLDYVIQPMLSDLTGTAQMWVEEYIRTLSFTPCGNAALAVSAKETELAQKLYKLDKDLINAIFATQFTKEHAELIIKEENYDQAIGCCTEKEELDLLRDLWNNNEDILKAVIYAYYRPDAKLFYQLLKNTACNKGYTVFDANDTVLYSGNCNTKIAKAILDAYLAAHPTATLEILRKAFPVAINDTVARYYDHLFYELPTVDNEGGYEILARNNNPKAPAYWSFYTKKEQLLSVNNKQVMCPNNWNATSIANLIETAQKLNIKIEEV
jgi:hypothetical protein